jgi:simple sugar transport system ATP-binding protein
MPKRGTMAGSHLTEDITLDAPTPDMAGGGELEEPIHELSRTPAVTGPVAAADPENSA